MNRLTLAACRPAIASILGVCTTDTRIPILLNEAQERLMSKGKWVGTVVRYRFCTSDSCLTMPRQIETIEAWALCDQPMTVRDRWYEFVQNGPGQRRSDLGNASQLIDRGTACSYLDISGPLSKINVVPSVTEDPAARILLQGYDQFANWIRTEDPAASGLWIDGEYVTLYGSGTQSHSYFSTLTGVIKPITQGPISLFEWPASLGGNLQQLAYYESDETLPIYRRYLVPALADTGSCSTSQDSCDNRTITVLAKLRHMPVAVDNDFLILGNLAALKLMSQAVIKEQRNLFQEAAYYEAKAVGELQNELSSFEGDGVVPILRMEHPDLWGGAVCNDISWPAFYGVY